MRVRRGFLVLGWVVLVAGIAGCVSDEVVYVDEQGNALAVDDAGRPVVPRPDPARAPAVVTDAPSPLSSDADRGFRLHPGEQPVRVGTAPSKAPADPDVPPTGALPPLPVMPDLPARPARAAPAPQPREPEAKKVDSSAGLGPPPGG